MMRSCSRAFERLWRIEPDKERVRARRFSVGAIQRFASGDQPPYERRFEQVIGNSPALESVLEQVERVAPTDSTVLIQGETGTGKELIAHAIHNLSSLSSTAKRTVAQFSRMIERPHRAKDWPIRAG